MTPQGIAIDSKGNYIVVDLNGGPVRPGARNGAIFTVTPTGTVTALVSDLGPEFENGYVGIAVDSKGDFIVTSEGRILRVTPDGTVTKIKEGSPLVTPSGVAIDSDGNFIVTDNSAHAIFKVTPGGVVTTVESGYKIINARGIAVDSSGDFIVADQGGPPGGCSASGIQRVKSSGLVSIIYDGPRIVCPVDVAIVGYTRVGLHVAVGLPEFPLVRLTYDLVTAPGTTSVARVSDPCLGSGMILPVGECFDFAFTGSFTNATISLPYDSTLLPAGRAESEIRLFHIGAGGTLEDVTTSLDVASKEVTGIASSFSFFVAGLPSSSSTSAGSSTAVGAPTCLIATVTFGSELAPEVQLLRNFRDHSIMKTDAGSNFMVAFNEWYYSFSPYVANYLSTHSVERTAMKGVLYPLIGILFVSSKLFSAMANYPEFAALLSGLAASSMIGAIYVGLPLTLLKTRVHRFRTTPKFLRRLLIFAVLSALVAVLAGEILPSPTLLEFSTGQVVLSTISLSAEAMSATILKRIA